MSTPPDVEAGVSILPTDLRPAVTMLVETITGRYGSPAPVEGVEEIFEVMRAPIGTLYPKAADDAVYALVTGEAMERIVIDIDPPVLLAPKFEPWFKDAVTSGSVKLERWYSYKQFLTHAKGFGPQVLTALDNASSDVVDLLGDPTQVGSWKRRGLVIGDVQSGKTATYIGIVNKAADAGYKLVVLLTGATESLRQQTQFRIDEGFLGKDSSLVNHDKLIGVGHHPTASTFLRGQGMTTHAKDFVTDAFISQAVKIDPNADHPYVFVMKKNVKPLDNLISWLRGQFTGDQLDIPMLVVDDESDYASVNTKKPDKDPGPINAKIRELLSLATRSSYMAFTATPFANVFIDHTSWDEALNDDLFPHHYIFALSAPSNYHGSEKYFGTTEEKLANALVDITDAHEAFPPKHKSTLSVPFLPASLEEAIRAYVVASAIRLVRGDEDARSMLVNVSRFKNVQGQVFDLVAGEFARIKNAIEIHATPPTASPDTHQVLKQLSRTFTNHFADSQTTWDAVRDKLLAAVVDTTVELINSSRDKSSDDNARNMIAVGGDVLSRGLTIDGLTVSYFYRIVGAADTLLQMARWFGYRPGYEDVVRVWITAEAADQFRFVHEISGELRNQIAEMRALGKTPADFGLMVRKHPESLAITAKKGVSETKTMVISLSGRRIETTKIPALKHVLQGNQKAVSDFLAAIDKDFKGTSWDQTEYRMKYMGKVGVSRERVADLLEAFRYDRGNLILANSLHKLIRNQTADAFQNWTVGIVSGEGGAFEIAPGITLDHKPQRAVRYSTDGTSSSFRVSGKSARLAGSTDLANTFKTRGSRIEPGIYSDLPHPTLLIYPLEPNWTVNPAAATDEARQAAADETAQAKIAWEQVSPRPDGVLMALKVTIPGDPGSKKGDVEYILNGPAIQEFLEDYIVDETDVEDLDG